MTPTNTGPAHRERHLQLGVRWHLHWAHKDEVNGLQLRVVKPAAPAGDVVQLPCADFGLIEEHLGEQVQAEADGIAVFEADPDLGGAESSNNPSFGNWVGAVDSFGSIRYRAKNAI